ncbi:TPA: hypothetical protein ACJ51G_001203 [Aeromonas hydrophila subsp. hydrophila]|uniref:hypothetical protein n=1 Tax=Aeromonas TaxID=642 RepID=UPI000FEB9C63|nr:hypothetical protein [Aeromonas caviae]RWT73691.1 hypothetical protein DN604_16510 [Aeromonas caviae]WVM47840.1 hypothetical protein V0242_24885 [Aeromonas hydrophila]
MTVKINENGMLEMTTTDAVDSIMESTFQALHTRGADPEKDRRLEAAYLKFSKGVPMLVEPANTVRYWYLRGPTGQGKTQSMRAACQRIADLMGVNFVFRPEDSYTPNKNDFVFNVLELAGEVSNMSTAGLVNVQEFEVEGEKIKFISKLPLKMIAGMKFAGFGFLLLDDFANAAMSVQTSLLSALLDKKLGALDLGQSSCFGLAGNMGTADGTKGISDTASITSRVHSAYIYDTLENFVSRTLNYYQNQVDDNLGDGHYSAFLEAYPDHFFSIEKAKRPGVPFPTSRMHESAVGACRHALHLANHYVSAGQDIPYDAILDKLFKRTAAAVGGDLATDLKSFYTCMLHYKAAPLARNIILEGKIDDAAVINEIRERKGNGLSADEMNFSARFTDACGDYASSAMASAIKSGDTELQNKILKNFAAAVFGVMIPNEAPLVMDEAHSRDMMSHFVQRLGVLVNDRKICFIDDVNRKAVVHHNLANQMLSVLSKNPLSALPDPIRQDQPRIMTLFADVITNSSWNKTDGFMVDDDTLGDIQEVLAGRDATALPQAVPQEAANQPQETVTPRTRSQLRP